VGKFIVQSMLVSAEMAPLSFKKIICQCAVLFSKLMYVIIKATSAYNHYYLVHNA
jgi:hypothetical protein